MDAGGAAQWSAELLELLTRNVPRTALAKAETGAPPCDGADARRHSRAAAALEARLRVELAIRAKTPQRVREEHASTVSVADEPSPPPKKLAANLRLVVNREWGLAARARARASASRRACRQPLLVPVSPADDDADESLPVDTAPGDWLDDVSTLGDVDDSLPSDEHWPAAAEPDEHSGSGAASEVDALEEAKQPDGSSERDAEDATLTLAVDVAGAAAQPDCVDAEQQTDFGLPAAGASGEVEPLQLLDESEPGPASPARRRPVLQTFPAYDGRRMLISRLRMQCSSSLTGRGFSLDSAPAPNFLLSAATAVASELGVDDAGGEGSSVNHVAAAASALAVAEPHETGLLPSREPMPTAGNAIVPGLPVSSGEPAPLPQLETEPSADQTGPPVQVEAVPSEPSCDSLDVEHFTREVLSLLVSEQSHGRLLGVALELPLALLEKLHRRGSAHRMLFDCMNEALFHLTLGAEATTTSLWLHRMSHLADASAFDAVCKALNQQLGAWLACANTDDARVRLQLQRKCDTAADERYWVSSVQRHIAELQAAER